MKVFSLTKLGRQVARTKEGEGDELRVLQFIQSRGTATDDELEIVGGRHLIRRLKNNGLVRELTT